MDLHHNRYTQQTARVLFRKHPLVKFTRCAPYYSGITKCLKNYLMKFIHFPPNLLILSMSNQNNTDSTDSKGIKTGWVIATLVGIAVAVVGFYMFNFHKGLSVENEIWGTFGDYVGGILNPVIAGFAFYLIAETYKLQKKELEATRKLLQVSADAQKDQIKLAALTARLNLNLTKISLLKTENFELLKESSTKSTDIESRGVNELEEIFNSAFRTKEENNILTNQDKIQLLTEKNIELEDQLEIYLKP